MLSGFTVTAALLSLPVLVPEAFIKFIANKFIVDNLAAAFPSVSGIANKFIANKFLAANLAADFTANDLISVSALPCVFGEYCEVVADSVELLAVAFLLALFC